MYCLRGMVCYYGLHYISIFQSRPDQEGVPQYLLFDDAHVRSLGSWGAVMAECVRSRYQPVLLLFELKRPGRQQPTAREIPGSGLGSGPFVSSSQTQTEKNNRDVLNPNPSGAQAKVPTQSQARAPALAVHDSRVGGGVGGVGRPPTTAAI